MGEMKPWPVMKAVEEMTVAEYLGNIPELDYERARAEAAIERLRVAVEALNSLLVADCHWYSSAIEFHKCDGYQRLKVIEDALSSIGDIPGDK
jgi:hypothetical protein